MVVITPGTPQVMNDSPEYNALLYGKTNLGGYFFDCFLKVDISQGLKVTEHPVETGADITDHAYLEAAELTFEIAMSDTAKSLVSGQFDGRWSRSVAAWDVLTEMQRNRIPLSALTRVGRYDNLLITSLSQTDTKDTTCGLLATVKCKQIMVAQVKTVKVSAMPHITDSTQKGTLQATEVVDRSWLKTGKLALFGK